MSESAIAVGKYGPVGLFVVTYRHERVGTQEIRWVLARSAGDSLEKAFALLPAEWKHEAQYSSESVRLIGWAFNPDDFQEPDYDSDSQISDANTEIRRLRDWLGRISTTGGSHDTLKAMARQALAGEPSDAAPEMVT